MQKPHMTKTKKRGAVSLRTAERLHRAAYDFESLASRFRCAGLDSYANTVDDIASKLGNMARSLPDVLDKL